MRRVVLAVKAARADVHRIGVEGLTRIDDAKAVNILVCGVVAIARPSSEPAQLVAPARHTRIVMSSLRRW
jgi:hypothetical protein